MLTPPHSRATQSFLEGLHVEDLAHLFSAIFDVRKHLALEPGSALDHLLDAVQTDIINTGFRGRCPDLFQELATRGGLHEAPRAERSHSPPVDRQDQQT